MLNNLQEMLMISANRAKDSYDLPYPEIDTTYQIVVGFSSSKEDCEKFLIKLKDSEDACGNYYRAVNSDNQKISDVKTEITTRAQKAYQNMYAAWEKTNPCLVETPFAVTVRKRDNLAEHNRQYARHLEDIEIKKKWKESREKYSDEIEARKAKIVEKASARRIEKCLKTLKRPVRKPDYYELYEKCEYNFSDLEVVEIGNIANIKP